MIRLPAISRSTTRLARALRVRAGAARGIIAFVLLCVVVPPTHGHGDLHERIEELSRRILASATNADLYTERAELRILHQEWDEAHVDLEIAAGLAPDQPAIDLVRGRLFLATGRPRSAKLALDRCLTHDTNRVAALVLRARAQVRLGLTRAAAADFTAAIARSEEPQPDYYLERANALALGNEADWDEALRGLDDGLRRLGLLVSLQFCAIDLEVKRHRYHAALDRLDTLALQYPGRGTWRTRRGELLALAGHAADAQGEFRAALADLEKLPPSRRNTPANLELEEKLHKLLRSTNAPGPSGSVQRD